MLDLLIMRNKLQQLTDSWNDWCQMKCLCVLFILNLGTEWCKLFSGRFVPRRRRRHWAGQGWCRSSCASGSLSHSGCYTQTTLSRWTSLHSLQSERKGAWSHQQPSLGSPKALPALCHAASNSGHKRWHEKHSTGTNPRLQHTKCMPEVTVQAEEMLMLNEKHPLMTIRVGRWPALSWKPTRPSQNQPDQNPCRFRELSQPEACALKAALFSRGR